MLLWMSHCGDTLTRNFTMHREMIGHENAQLKQVSFWAIHLVHSSRAPHGMFEFCPVSDDRQPEVIGLRCSFVFIF
jgi:hypothetical protein